MASDRASVAIVGGGIIGLCSAYYLNQRGVDVLVIDAAEPGNGASRGNAGWITPSLSGPVPAPGVVRQSIRWMFKPDSPLYIKPRLDFGLFGWLLQFWRYCNQGSYRRGLTATAELALGTFDLFDGLRQDGVEFEEHHAGLLFAFLTPSAMAHVEDDLRLLAPYGYSPLVVGKKEARELEPALADAVIGGVWMEQERQVRPESLTTGLTKRLLNEGVEFRPHTPVTSFELDRHRVQRVVTTRGTIGADAVLIATGAWAPGLAGPLGARIPIQPGKGYSLHYEPPPIPVSRALYLYEAKVGVTPLESAVRFAGTMEFSGINDVIETTRIRAIADAGRRYLRDWPVGLEGAEQWTGMRPMTPDGLPIIGRLHPWDNVFIASGHAMLGMTLGPATGRAVADMITTGHVPEVLRPFDPGRFGAPLRREATS